MKKKKQRLIKRSLKEIEIFYNCNTVCKCEGRKCKATGLKEYRNCHNILKSICSKVTRKVDGKQPYMILPACSTRKRKLSESDINLSEDEKTSDDEFDNIV